MFLVEQQINSAYELVPAIGNEDEFNERHVWSPVSCRWTHWMYEGLMKCDERGRIKKGSFRRDPFIVGSK